MKLKELDHIQNDSYVRVLDNINKNRIETIKTTFSDLYSGIELVNIPISEKEMKKLAQKNKKVNG